MKVKRATDEGSLPEIAQYSPYYLPLNVLLLPKDQTFIFYLLLLQLVLCRVAAVKSLPVHYPDYPYISADYIFISVL